MGKVRDLDLNDLKPFEDGVNDDLANFNGINLKGRFRARRITQEMVSFYWGANVKKEYQPDDPNGIPLIMWWLITGQCDDFQPAWDLRTTVIRNLCPDANIIYIAEDLCDLYKKNSKYYGADKFRKVEIEYKPNAGLMMTLKFYRNGQ